MLQAIHWFLPSFEGSLEAKVSECFEHFIGFCLCLRVAWRLFLRMFQAIHWVLPLFAWRLDSANVSSNSLGFAFV